MSMRKVFKQVISYLLVPLTRFYLRKERSYTYRGTTVRVNRGVFHPGLFYSTRFLLDYLSEQELDGKTILELGCGTGLISIVAAKMNAKVTASDVSVNAINNIMRNCLLNTVHVEIIHSDLFDKIPVQPFQWIVINPPYYVGEPKDESQFAWYCGEDFNYFRKLFPSLKNYCKSDSVVVMVLTKGSDVQAIQRIGLSHGVEFVLLRENAVLFDEKDFLFQLIFHR